MPKTLVLPFCQRSYELVSKRLIHIPPLAFICSRVRSHLMNVKPVFSSLTPLLLFPSQPLKVRKRILDKDRRVSVEWRLPPTNYARFRNRKSDNRAHSTLRLARFTETFSKVSLELFFRERFQGENNPKSVAATSVGVTHRVETTNTCRRQDSQN